MTHGHFCCAVQGVKVSSVAPGSPAALHDPPIKVGDVLIDVNDTYVLDKSYFDTTTEVATAGAAAGAVVTFTLASGKAFKAVHGGDSDSESDDDSEDGGADGGGGGGGGGDNGGDDDDDDDDDDDGDDDKDSKRNASRTSSLLSPDTLSPNRGASAGTADEHDADEAHAKAVKTPPPEAFFDAAGVDVPTASSIEQGLAALVKKGAASPPKSPRSPTGKKSSGGEAHERVCRIARPKLGGLGLEIAPAGIPPGSQFGARVARVKAGGPAEAAGVRLNDLILGVNGRAVGSFSLSQVGLEIGAAGSDVVLTVVAIAAVESGQFVAPISLSGLRREAR
jgi:hypothetical protein